MSTLNPYDELDTPDIISANDLLAASIEARLSEIKGLGYQSEFVTAEEEGDILDRIDKAEWSTELARRVQHYGFKYDYKARRIDDSMHIGRLPDWLTGLGKRLVDTNIFEKMPEQIIVNEYLPGQGIAPHIDCRPCFGDTIASLTLNTACVMDFTDPKNHVKIPVLLERRSLVVLKGEARYRWRHGIAKRQQDTYEGLVIRRRRRVSLTFRTIKMD